MSLYINSVVRYTGINTSYEAHAFIFRAEDTLPTKQHGVTAQKKVNFASRLATKFCRHISCLHSVLSGPPNIRLDFIFFNNTVSTVHTAKAPNCVIFSNPLSVLLF